MIAQDFRLLRLAEGVRRWPGVPDGAKNDAAPSGELQGRVLASPNRDASSSMVETACRSVK